MSDTSSEKPPIRSSYYYPLFEHMSLEHGLTLLDSELDEICRVVAKIILHQGGPTMTEPNQQEIEQVMDELEDMLGSRVAMKGSVRHVAEWHLRKVAELRAELERWRRAASPVTENPKEDEFYRKADESSTRN